MRIYLDSNVLIDALEERQPGLYAELLAAKTSERCSFPYSAEHVSELAFGTDEAANARLLAELSRLSGDEYFVHDVYTTGFKSENPARVHATLREVPHMSKLEAPFVQMVSHSDHVRARSTLGIDVNELNNLSPAEAVERVERMFSSYEIPKEFEGAAPRSIADFIRSAEDIQRQTSSEHWKRIGGDPERMLSEGRIVCLFSLFDSFGYWPDDRRTYEKGSRFPDSRHAFNASRFDMFVSRDRRLLKKASAAYLYLKVSTKCLNLEEFLAWLRFST